MSTPKSPACRIVPVVQPNTTSPNDPVRRWQLATLVASAAAVVALAVAIFAFGRGSLPDGRTFTASGTIVVLCDAERISGHEVEITDMSGKTLAKSVMGTGHPLVGSLDCAYPFVVRDVPADGVRYYVTVLAKAKYIAIAPISVSELDLSSGLAEIHAIAPTRRP